MEGQDRGLLLHYTLEEDGAEILSFQWHPKGPSAIVYPHLHLEQFLWLLIDGFHVKHKRPDWKDVLVKTRKKFEQWRTWE